jgi:hypothetical protein
MPPHSEGLLSHLQQNPSLAVILVLYKQYNIWSIVLINNFKGYYMATYLVKFNPGYLVFAPDDEENFPSDDYNFNYVVNHENGKKVIAKHAIDTAFFAWANDQTDIGSILEEINHKIDECLSKCAIDNTGASFEIVINEEDLLDASILDLFHGLSMKSICTITSTTTV